VARPGLLFAGCAAIAVSIIGGCSVSLVATSTDDGASTPAAPVRPARATPVRAADTAPASAIAKTMAQVALDDHDLSQIRGGFSTSSGLLVNFAFQQATYVNGNLAQNIVTPTITVSPGSSTANVGGSTVFGTLNGFSPTAVANMSNSAAQLAANSPTQAVQSVFNNGATSILSNVNGGSVSNVISNTASNQAVQQFLNANIDITGLSKTIQQSVASTVLGSVRTATSQFR
jgi:hypothetical protein